MDTYVDLKEKYFNLLSLHIEVMLKYQEISTQSRKVPFSHYVEKIYPDILHCNYKYKQVSHSPSTFPLFRAC